MSIKRIKLYPAVPDVISQIAKMQFSSMRQIEYAGYTVDELVKYAMDLKQLYYLWHDRLIHLEYTDDNHESMILVAEADEDESCLSADAAPDTGSFSGITKKLGLAVTGRQTKQKVIGGVIFVTVLREMLYIRSLYVSPDMVRNGIGTSLLYSAVLQLANMHYVREIRLEVFAENAGAVSLYSKAHLVPFEFEYPYELGGTAASSVPSRFRVMCMAARFGVSIIRDYVEELKRCDRVLLPFDLEKVHAELQEKYGSISPKDWFD